MKIKKVTLAIIASVGILATGSFLLTSQYVANATNTNYIGVSKAKSIATKDAGVSANQAKFYTSKLDYEDGRAVYDIEFYVGNVEYDYEIDATTGRILEKDLDIENFTIPQKTTNSNQSYTNSNSNYIGVAKAKSIATKDAGVNANQAKFYTSKLDYEYGRAVYDIEFYVGNVEYDYEIDAITGKILEKDMDIENFTIPQRNTQTTTNNNSNYIGIEKAKSIALKHAGVSSARFTKAKVDTENGVRVYEIEFKVNGVEYEYEIDAKTGAIRDFDIDD